MVKFNKRINLRITDDLYIKLQIESRDYGLSFTDVCRLKLGDLIVLQKQEVNNE